MSKLEEVSQALKSVTISEANTMIEPDSLSQHDTESDISIHFSEVKFECAYCLNPVAAHCCTCEDYLCKNCSKKHRRIESFVKHDICYFFCGEKLKTGKKVRASAYCRNCVEYLCEKCELMHSGYRKYRNHVIVTGVDMPFVNTVNIAKKDMGMIRRLEQRSKTRTPRVPIFTGRTQSGKPCRYLDFLNKCSK